MRLVTVNLYNGRVVPRDFERFLDEYRPDVVCAQEVGPDAGRILERRFRYGAVSPSLEFAGRALVSVHPMRAEPFALAFRGGYRGSLDLEGRPTDVLTIHLANPLEGLTGVRARRAQLDGIEPQISTMTRGVLAGDMNATPWWPAYRRLAARLTDGVSEWAEREGVRAPPTWARYPSWPALLRIDHVFTRALDVTAARVARIAGLDHRALVVDLALPSTP